jgi:hypothetical protein
MLAPMYRAMSTAMIIMGLIYSWIDLTESIIIPKCGTLMFVMVLIMDYTELSEEMEIVTNYGIR